MRYTGIIKNDFAAAPGVCLTVFVQGCPIHCKNCHNPESWDFNNGKIFTNKTLNQIEQGLLANGIKRTLCIMGGEPLCNENSSVVKLIIQEMKKRIKNLKIWVWTGYKKDKVFNSKNLDIKYILNNINGIVTEPYIDELKDITLFMRGSSNQEVIKLK